MRLFVALELPSDLRQQLVQLSRAIRDDLPPARWVAEQNLHLTLLFLGDTPQRDRERLDRALQPFFAATTSFRLQPDGAGTFPPGRRTRVAWVGFEREPRLERLQAGVAEAASRALARQREERPFRAHLTLARCRAPWPRAAQRAWTDHFASCELLPFNVEQGSLMQSRLEPTGAVYSAESSYPLRSAPGEAA